MFAFAPTVSHKLGEELISFSSFGILLQNIDTVVQAQFGRESELQIHSVIFLSVPEVFLFYNICPLEDP